MTKKFDVVVVGAGPAGSAAALTAAKNGARVALLERGLYPGAKNFSGAGLYDTEMIEHVFPGFAYEAPIERYISRKMLGFITPEQLFSAAYQDDKKSAPPYAGYTVLRPQLDKYLADRAVKEGVTLLNETVVTDIITEGEQVVGVVCNGSEKLLADVVIACDGVNSFIGKKLGMVKPFTPHQMSLGVKEVIRLPKNVLEDRFLLKGNEGVAFELVGSVSKNVNGGGFIYTNQDSVSIGLVAQVEDLKNKGYKPYDMLEEFKRHPAIEPMIRGGITQEYGGHLIPEGGYDCLAELSRGGVMLCGDAAGFVLVTGYLLLGINFAIESGAAAGKAAAQAVKQQDVSAAAMKAYDKALADCGMLETFKNFRKAPANTVNNENLQNSYPEVICTLMHNLYDVCSKPIPKVMTVAKKSLKDENLKIGGLLKDVKKIGGALIW
ncbi:MAG: FAD-dependent oxidoreductase [Bacillota bacterium]|jgi:electron transfer flavoprotein-quinone oxidoreductase